MGETSFKTIQLPQSVIKQVDQAVKESEGFFSSRAELIKQATMRYIEELRKKNMILHAQFPTQNPSSDPLVTSGVTMGRKFNPIATSNAPCLSITQDYKFHIKSDKWELVGTISEIFTVTL
ncbi:MAG: hypothetical protein GWN31_08570, partial [Candidatus Thorarchaeota archaeon]|nr:hypothetical protein [Candidatus Thorarchaeota archaeon]NIW13971.1 hypothetical protein [Candidatus Thorarchaeota archaeon]